jgi:hypothetical protein
MKLHLYSLKMKELCSGDTCEGCFRTLIYIQLFIGAKRALTRLHVRQGPFVNSSKSFHQNIKAFFKNFFIS